MTIQNYLSQERPRERRVDDQQLIGIAGFNALVRVTESYVFSADAPTTPLEDGSLVNDHVILNPVTLTIDGDVSDLHQKSRVPPGGYRKKPVPVGGITSFLPERTQTQIRKIDSLSDQANDILDEINDLARRGQNPYGDFGNQAVSKPNQENFIDRIEALYKSKQPIQIEMPFRIFDDMVITEFQTRFDNRSMSTGFKISAQQVRFAEVVFTEVESLKRNPSGEVKDQTAGETQKGLNKTEDRPRSLLSTIFG